MKKLIEIIAFFLFFFISSTAFAQQNIWRKIELGNFDLLFKKLSKNQFVESVLFEIDSEPYTFSDVLEFINERTEKKVSIIELSRNIDMFKVSLREMIIQQLLLKEAESLGIKVGDEEVVAYMDEIKRQNKVDNEGFKKLLATRGMKEEDYKKQVINDILRSRVISTKVRSKVNVMDDEIKAKHNDDLSREPEEGEILVEQISFKFDTFTSEEEKVSLKDKLEGIRKKVIDGSDMSDLGDSDYLNLGYVKPKDLIEDLQEGIRNLKENEVSDVISSRDGFYLLKLNEHNNTAPKIESREKEKIRKEIYEEKFKISAEEYLKEGILSKHVVELKL